MDYTVENIKWEGAKYGLLIALLGITITYVFFVTILSEENFYGRYLWFIDCGFGLILISGTTLLLILGYYFGQKTSINIVVNKANRNWSGIKCVFSMYVISIFIANLIGFIFLDDGIQDWNTMKFNFYTYTLRPVIKFSINASIPMIIIGIILGVKLEKYRIKINA